MEVKVTEIRLLNNGRPLKAFVDVQIGNITVRDFRVIQDSGKAYVRAPHTTYKDSTGTLRFRQIVDLPDEVRGQVDTLILSDYYHREKELRNEKQKR